jgi:hypothetical protein
VTSNEFLKIVGIFACKGHKIGCMIYVIIIPFAERLLSPNPVEVGAVVTLQRWTQRFHEREVLGNLIYPH